jgi:hypothetical protein
MEQRVTSFILGAEERERMQVIANERYGGSVAQLIRAALAAQYKELANITNLPRRPGGQLGKRKRKL